MNFGKICNSQEFLAWLTLYDRSAREDDANFLSFDGFKFVIKLARLASQRLPANFLTNLFYYQRGKETGVSRSLCREGMLEKLPHNLLLPPPPPLLEKVRIESF